MQIQWFDFTRACHQAYEILTDSDVIRRLPRTTETYIYVQQIALATAGEVNDRAELVEAIIEHCRQELHNPPW